MSPIAGARRVSDEDQSEPDAHRVTVAAGSAARHLVPPAPSGPGRSFQSRVEEESGAVLRRGRTTTLQINVGRRCNQACHHCHVAASPLRTETMSRRVADRVLDLLAASPAIELLDITGGAPELCAEFERLVNGARALGRRVMDRCNLTILQEKGQEHLAQFLAEQRVEVIASLPCYTAANVDGQRGKGVFDRSIEGLRRLNALGYGEAGTGLLLDLVYNPAGASLPPCQDKLRERYAVELAAFGVRFDRLLTLTNMPIARFAEQLERRGELDSYMGLLVNHFNPSTLPGLMCRTLVSVGWDGALFDCDFNQMLEMPLRDGARALTIFDIESTAALLGLRIETASHCFGCTAGAGSSCGGAIGA